MKLVRYLLDTNTVTNALRERPPQLRQRILRLSPTQICISVITEAEIHYGLARRPVSPELRHTLESFLLAVEILPWTSAASSCYGNLRAANEKSGITAGSLDLLIAAHGLAEDATLVTSDKGFRLLKGGPRVVDWTL